jgi:hypothetical protein
MYKFLKKCSYKNSIQLLVSGQSVSMKFAVKQKRFERIWKLAESD